MNHLNATFFSMIKKARHLTASDAPTKVILDLNASNILLGVGAPVIWLKIRWSLEPFEEQNPHNVVRE